LDQVVTHQAGLLFEKIVDFVPTDDEMKTLHLLVECICNEILFNNRTPPEVSMKLLVIMLLIESHGNKRTHSMVFRALRKSKYQAELFKDCCILKLKGLSRSGGIEELSVQKEEDLDVLEVAVSLSYIDFKVFTVDRKLWKRELFASNLFHEFKASQTEQMNFYRNWRQIEDKFGRERSTTLLALIQQRILSFESLEQINGTFLFFIYEISRIEIAVNILENELLPLKSPTKMWCRELVKNGLKGSAAQGINREYLNELAEKMSNAKFDVTFVLFKSISIIDDLRTFESLIEFCTDNELTEKDIECINVDGMSASDAESDLRRLKSVKFICELLKTKEVTPYKYKKTNFTN